MTVWRSRLLTGAEGSVDVLIEGEPEATVGSLATSLRDQGYAIDEMSVDGRPVRADQTLADVVLVHGSTIGLGPTERMARPGRGRFLVVVAGPDTGRWVELQPGYVATVGRGASCTMPLSDALLSGEHLAVHWTTDGALHAEDRRSTNGTLWEGVPLVGAQPITIGTYLQVGTSIVTVVDIGDDDIATLPGAVGAAVPFQRHFRAATEPPPATLRAPRPPAEASEGFGTSWLRMLAPLFGGVMMAVIMDRWIFLLVIAISPIIFVVDNLRRKRQRQEQKDEEQAAYQSAVTAFLAQQEAWRGYELQASRALASPGGMAALHGLARHRRLWERSPADEDFGSVTIGLATVESSIQIEGDLPEDRPATTTLWGAPLSHSLVSEGPLAVVGPSARSRAVARSMVIELVTAHSPADLVVWVLTSEGREDDWNCLRWLPHAYADEHSVRIGATAHARAAFVSDLQRLIANRRDAKATRDELVLPLHVVVVDGVASLPGSDLTEILVLGAGVGVTGVVIDETLVPEGTRGRVGIGEFADVASFSSGSRPRRDDVITFEITARQADQVSRHLAGLRPATAAAARGSGSTRLLDLAAIEQPTSAALAQSWRSGPSSKTVVGLDGEVPVVIDIVKGGPHGLVGGTTRSGKTEFLKTFLMGLALGNHPDDLAIAIIDFKGGVDHEMVAELPHVIGLSTNNDIDSFTRATALLNAELVRRQDLFRGAGAANLDAYRGARERDQSLLQVPRLIVVVDEFGELLASETGKASLGQLESITRIGGGLGVHLLLVTQNFENQLPAQIAANAGLRVCFRVQQGSHSKIVLDSDVAASIPAERVGRAFVRSHGGPLQEFQTARVAGPRPGAVIESSDVRVTVVPFGAAASVTPATMVVDVPVTQTDLFDLVQASKQAAADLGWRRPVVPWPDQLPEDLSLRGLLEPLAPGAAGAEAWPIGLVDRPERQRHELATFGPVTDLTVCVGGPRSGLAEVLQTVAVSGALHRSPAELHLYVIDQLGQGLAGLARLPHCGGVATRNDPLALRMLTHLSREVARRKSLVLSAGAGSVGDLRQRGHGGLPDVLLLVHGGDRLVMQGESGESPLLAPLLTLLADLGGSGVGVVISGLPTVAHHRMGNTAVRRLVFPMSDRQDLVGVDVARDLIGQLTVPGRAYDSATGMLVQVAARLSDDGVSQAELVEALGERLRADGGAVAGGPELIRDVPWPLSWAQAPAIEPPSDVPVPLTVGVSLESASYAWLDGEEDGPVFAVAGASKSGRSSALQAIARFGRLLGYRTVGTALSRRSPLLSGAGADLDKVVPPQYLADELGPQRTMVLIDDVHRWGDDVEPLEKLLAHDGELIVVVAGPTAFFELRSDVTRALGSIRTGLVLMPTSARDGDAFGLRRINDDVVQDNRPGRGVLVVAGEAVTVQVPFLAG